MKVSSRQLFWLMWMFDVGMALLLTIGPTIEAAKQDAWISVCIATLGGIAIAWVSVKIGLVHPDKSFVEIIEFLLGKWTGKLVMFLYLIVWVSVTGIILREFGDFVHVALFDRTPLWVILLTFECLMVYAVLHSGLEGIARMAELLGPIAVLALVVAILMSLGNVKYQFVLPVYVDSGLQNIIKGTLPTLSFVGESIVIMMLVVFVRDKENITSNTLKAVSLAGACILVAVVFNVFMFGPNLPSRMVYPSFEFTRFISMMEFIQNIDSIFVVIWLMSFFVKLSLYLFISSYGMSQWLGFTKYTHVVWFLSVVIFAIALFPSFTWVKTVYLNSIWIPYVLPINMVGIPILLWVIHFIKQRAKNY